MKMTVAKSDETIRAFGEQWSHYTQNDGYYGSLELFADEAIGRPALDALLLAAGDPASGFARRRRGAGGGARHGTRCGGTLRRGLDVPDKLMPDLMRRVPE